jgi:cytochrome c556
MKLFLTGCLCFFASFAFAQDNGEMPALMKAIGQTNGSLRKNIEAKQGPEAAKDAQKLADVYKQVGDFFAKTHTDDAVEIAKKGQTAAMEVATAATAGNFEAAAASSKALGGTCGPCHMAHREKLEAGGYKIK